MYFECLAGAINIKYFNFILLLEMFIVSLTIIYIYYNNNYEKETQNKK